MVDIFDRQEIPDNQFQIPQLNLAQHCMVERLEQPWFCLGELSNTSTNEIDSRLCRETLLLKPKTFQKKVDRFNSVGAVLRNLGHPTAWSSSSKNKLTYRYVPFHSFRGAFDSLEAEPLVFVRLFNGELIINPDIWLLLELTEKQRPEHVWYDQSKHCDVIKIRRDAKTQRVLILTDYLMKYLHVRQSELMISEFRQHVLYDEDLEAPEKTFRDYIIGVQTLVNHDKTAKVVFESWGPQRNSRKTSYVRRMQYWSVTQPPKLNKKDPFEEIPTFDLGSFLLPTAEGMVAPARFRGSLARKTKFKGTTCEFMDSVYFRQEVQVRYQNLPGYAIEDDGAIRNNGEWSFARTARRIGDDYLAIAIGDFAEGVTLSEWQHWGQFAVKPPGNSYFKYMQGTKNIVGLINRLVSELYGLNEVFQCYCYVFARDLAEKPVWKGADNDQAIKELKWFFPEHANESEFRRRATLLSTLLIDDLDHEVLRALLTKFSALMPGDGQLKGRKLLERFTLTARLMKVFKTSDTKSFMELLKAKSVSSEHQEARSELQTLESGVFKMFTPLAGLYELRIAAGYAHPINDGKFEAALLLLDLNDAGSGRALYRALLEKLIFCVEEITEALWLGVQAVSAPNS